MKLAIVEGVRPTLMPEGTEIERKILGESFDIRWYGLIKPEEYKITIRTAPPRVSVRIRR